MHLAKPSSSTLIWLGASLVAALSCALYLSAAHLNGEYLPVGNDSFYHARRILDTVSDPSSFYQFDQKIHAPDGSLLVWPWGYDYAMAQLVRLGLAIGISSDPMAILIWIPVLGVFISIALLVQITRRLELPTPLVALAAFCMALSTTTQFLHGVGQIDHHYAEFILILAALSAGLRWFREPDELSGAAALAFLFGIAPAIHNGMFILQVPFLITLLIRWLHGSAFERRTTWVFAAVLVTTTLVICIPSLAFRTGSFEFYTLSWFHLYIASCSAAITVLCSFRPKSARSLALLLGGALILGLPVLDQVDTARSFVAGSFKWLETIAEMKSPVRAAFTPEGPRTLNRIYSYLIWVAPFTFLLCLIKGWHDRSSARLLFWVTSAFGLALLATQIRMHYFGNFALYLPWLVLINDLTQSRPELSKRAYLGASLAMLLMFSPVLRHQLVAPVSPANDHTFADTRPLYSALQRACTDDPGIVLADNNLGHPIRYYTDCSVLVNNFLLTPLHFQKMDQAERFFGMSANELLEAELDIKYVLIRPLDIRKADDPTEGYKYWSPFPGAQRLGNDLLLGTPDQVPEAYTLLGEIRFPGADNIVYARLYKIDRENGRASQRR